MFKIVHLFECPLKINYFRVISDIAKEKEQMLSIVLEEKDSYHNVNFQKWFSLLVC